MAADRASGPPQAGGGPSPMVKYALIGGALIVAYILYSRYKGSGASASTISPSGLASTPGPYQYDPSSGQVIDTQTGLPVLTSQPTNGTNDLTNWVSAAFKAVVGAGVDPGAASGALYNYTNGNPLTAAQGGIIDKALGLVGMAPGDQLPFNPTPAPTPPGGTGTLPPASPPGAIAKLPNAIQDFVNKVYANIHAGTVKTPANMTKAEAYVKSGQASLPQGFTAPKGYTLNPGTRILTKKAA